MLRADAPTITLALIDWLDERYQDKTITTEISINTSYGTKVADVVVSNGHAMAFEIKSAYDTTQRLDEQINGYAELFEYVYLVYWEEKYTLESLSLPENIGAIKAFLHNGKIEFKEIKKAKINNFASPTAIGKLLWKNELEYFLRQKNIPIKTSFDKFKLLELFAQSHTKTESKKIFRFILKKRFERGFDAYKSSKLISSNPLKSFIDCKKDLNYISKLINT